MKDFKEKEDDNVATFADDLEHFTDVILPYRSHMCTPLPLFPFKRNRFPEGGFHPVLMGLAKLWPGLKKIIIN